MHDHTQPNTQYGLMPQAAPLYAPPPPYPAPPNRTVRNRTLGAALAVVVVAAGVVVGVVITRGQGSGSTKAAHGSGVPTTSHAAGKQQKVVDAAGTSSSPTVDFAAMYARQQSGVVRIEVLGCSQSGIGTGFLLSPTLIATVDHVVTGSVVVSLVDGTQRTTGRVIGSDPGHDLALVQAAQPLTGFHYHFAATQPRVGDQVATIGFPIGDPITLTHGDVSGLERTVNVQGTTRSGLIETDTALNPGNSGGPLVTPDGAVVGLVDALNVDANGIGYAVPSTQAQPIIAAWQQDPQTSAPASCQAPLGPTQETADVPAIPGANLDPAAAQAIATAFNTYFDGINTGDYASAYNVLSPLLRSGSTEESFAEGDATSFDFDERVISSHQIDSATVRVALTFTSLQSPSKGPDGDSCDVWTLNYTMIDGGDGAWYIDATKPYHGRSHTSC